MMSTSAVGGVKTVVQTYVVRSKHSSPLLPKRDTVICKNLLAELDIRTIGACTLDGMRNASAAAAALGCGGEVLQDADTPSFCAFLAYVAERPSADPHWRPISRACAADALAYTRVVRTEQPADTHALYSLLASLGRAWLPATAHAQLAAVVQGSAEPVAHAFRDPRLFYTRPLRALVERVWAADVQRFNHSFDELVARANAYVRRTEPDQLAREPFLPRKRNTALSLAVGAARPPRTLDGHAVLAYRVALHRYARACLFAREWSPARHACRARRRRRCVCRALWRRRRVCARRRSLRLPRNSAN